MSNSKEVGGIVKCINTKPLPGNEVAPPLEMDKVYVVKDVVRDKNGNPHLDVGLKSNYNYVSSYETKEELPYGDKIHWCHPSRFEVV
jgi:hypothetical protein